MFYLSDKFQELFANNSLCKKFIESSPDAIVVNDASGVVLAGNTRAAELFGYIDKNTIPPNVIGSYKNEEDRGRVLDMLSRGESVQDFETEILDGKGQTFTASLSVSTMLVEDSAIHISIIRDISERKKTEVELREGEKKARLNETRFEALSSLAGMAEAELPQLYDFALEAAVRITGSEIGYIYFLNEDESELRLYAWSRKVMPQCSVESIPDAYHVADTGVWGEAIRQRRPMILNDYERCTEKKGLPAGHVPVARHMNVPIFDGGKIVLLAGVGNKDNEYGDEDVRQLSLLMEGMWNIVRRKQADEELHKAYAEMETKVEERTAELSKALAEQKVMFEEVKRLASTDSLTGANNRRFFMDRAEIELDRLSRYGGELYLMMLDIDHFKNVNDTYGHSVGDVVLKELVKCCTATLRTSDVFGRLGGEEFAALLVHGSVESAILVAERLRQAIEDLEVRSGEHVVKFTVSIGLAMVCADEDIESALRHADGCLYKAKSQGRNRVVSYCAEV
ncbi:diguanylate cyclase [Desulfovibrio sp. JC010]|uniref:sensor domain-containing diguanylate cyclase n=1 Tax=Desulfovibrio sp. JC010 TaxID=2593641 RepID=UPI0013D19325|nr:diguanylate cyclase [Desulfovibrio sp. JC010]NDV25244.1 diguanylate cyclase [Desulfovibrio sp. JC010]